jgi:quercetin dioxygenase-like cupin family protein
MPNKAAHRTPWRAPVTFDVRWPTSLKILRRSVMIRGMSIVVGIVIALCTAPAAVAQSQAGGGGTHDHRRFQCLDEGLKSSEVGCLLLAKREIARFPQGAVFWHLNKFPSRAAAEAAKGQTDMVVEAEGVFWVFSFGPKDAAPRQGQLVASVGPLQMSSEKLPAAKSYEVVAYLAVMPAGTHTRVHTHPGPEAWYVLDGEQCLETPEGTIKARAGEGAMVRPTIPMRLTNNGSSTRRALFIVIHNANQPWMSFTDEWKPTGACDR